MFFLQIIILTVVILILVFLRIPMIAISRVNQPTNMKTKIKPIYKKNASILRKLSLKDEILSKDRMNGWQKRQRIEYRTLYIETWY